MRGRERKRERQLKSQEAVEIVKIQVNAKTVLVYRQIDRQTNKQTNKQTKKQTNKQRSKEINRSTYKQIDIQTD